MTWQSIPKRLSACIKEKDKGKIQLANYMCGVFIDRFGKDISFRPIDDEHSKLHVDVNVSPQFFGWIFSLGKDVKVVGPKEVVEELHTKTKEFLGNQNKEILYASEGMLKYWYRTGNYDVTAFEQEYLVM